ncbi:MULTISPECIES: alpha/beta hydrolase [Virgibacillus]|uniref:Carboxylesterase n=2 Tax=Virgibacillus TaxID=84406 RepID=A0A024QA12_9BACI|nr:MULTISPECIES: carboxylesterase [Virgibacillus]EQB37396.1 carboxylesterase [Virgibacillus sp. CM-4]MYL40146.1 abhydrolase domain-containing 18 [Virgibacillus massiliensis]GGJ61247.1 carboxylesterase [Virgibacillus kapii]CDQ39107.1 Carboxylesterase [Virgibacillus massiliensis]
MKVKQPQPFTFEAGPRAVLLLHGFTGHSADVRMLGRYLEKRGYTSHAPIYRGHGLPPEELVKATPKEWWADVKEAYNHLKELGYEEIAVAGLSLGGVLSLKLAFTEKTKAVVTMCSPMFFDNETQLTKGFQTFSKEYKQLEGKDEAVIEKEVEELLEQSTEVFQQLGKFITEVKNEVDTIYTPAMVVQARQDEMINTDSANYIYENVESDHKALNWYENSGHVITMDKEKEQVFEDIYQFLETLDWEE